MGFVQPLIRTVERGVENTYRRVLEPTVSAVTRPVQRATTMPGTGTAPPPPPTPLTPSDPPSRPTIEVAPTPAAEARAGSIKTGGNQEAAQRLAAGAAGGDTGFAIDPLGRRGRGAVGQTTLLGK